jgi:hypothetical protein
VFAINSIHGKSFGAENERTTAKQAKLFIDAHQLAGTAGVGNLEAFGVVLVEAVTLESMHGNSCLVLIVKFNKTQNILSCGILFAFFCQQAKGLVARKRAENIWD